MHLLRYVRSRISLLCCLTSLCGCAQNLDDTWQKHHQRGLQSASSGDFLEAIKQLQSAVDDAENRFSRDDIRLAISLNDLADTFVMAGQSEKSNTLYQRAINVEEPNQERTPEWRKESSRSQLGLANFYRDMGSLGLAAIHYQRGLSILDNLESDESIQLKGKINKEIEMLTKLSRETNFAFDHLPKGRTKDTQATREFRNHLFSLQKLDKNAPFDKAESYWLNTLELAKTRFGEREDSYRYVLFGLAHFYSARGQSQKAEQLIKHDMTKFLAAEAVDANAKPTMEQVEDALMLSKDMSLLGQFWKDSGRLKESLAIQERGIAILTRCRQKSLARVSHTINLGDTYFSAHEYEKAHQQYESALELLASLPADNDIASQLLIRLSDMERSFHRDTEAERHMDALMICLQRQTSPNWNDYTQRLVDLADIKAVLGKKTEAQLLYERASHCCSKHKLANDLLPGQIQICLASILPASRWREAEQHLQKARQLAMQMKDPRKKILQLNRVLVTQGEVRADRGLNAENSFVEALALAKQLKDDTLISNTTTRFCDYYQFKGKLQDARAIDEDTLAYWRKNRCRSPHAQACVHWSLNSNEMLTGHYLQALEAARTGIRLELSDPNPYPGVLVTLFIRQARTHTFLRERTLAERTYNRAVEYCKKNSFSDPYLHSELHKHWAIANWLWGNEAAFAQHLQIAVETSARLHQDPEQAVNDLVRTIRLIYMQGANLDNLSKLAAAKSCLAALRRALGEQDLAYVCAIKEFELYFANARQLEEAAELHKLAEAERVAAVKAVNSDQLPKKINVSDATGTLRPLKLN